MKVNKGEIATLSCQFQSSLPVQVDWYLNDTNISQQVNTYKDKFEYHYELLSQSVTLIIKNINFII